ncbi:glutamate-ammonia-ligase adenylyltransferase [Sulfuritortus calidifontis]|uniref:Bifunctional glutamine synthetase adenylyltransferase/adenylyl-removing enzyme n=1 Tax=Sulfuritortus calidifontis TaxID=1914471 RepID=A0A4R3K0A6_9PROT|nr:bifunctional [glutamate--ammonia ligase]-adenylyl-L-tyrosine phosphorylase/[glutamate--ammonia-ligase] adenylyltransferase [Sulfuritortus calidifontis]TCS73338.1 glutamate-ammonia-ligase adenylyltransferase [Sulfuritortus calidifontis]
MPIPSPQESIDLASRYSRYLQGRLVANPELRAGLEARLEQPVSRAEMAAWLAERSWTDEAGLKQALRRLRQEVMCRLIVRDLSGRADLAEVTRSLTELAELAVQQAADWLHADLAAVHGQPLDGQGQPQRLIVVGMGKLGGFELNASSDIDLIFVFPEDGETDGTRKLSNFEFFTRLGKRLINAIGEPTADGFVFRVDMRLRPYGDSGPLVSSFAMLEDYFYTQAREWERYAWIKARALTGERIEELEALRLPFVFRKYLDFGALKAMRELHAQIRREVARRDMADNIKLGPGGIREVEFIAQVFQLIRGGKLPSLQARPTRAILHQLAAFDLMPEAITTELETAYVFLRNLEHRLQYRDDAQTQTLPHSPEEQALLAQAMGFADYGEFLKRLDSLRRRVSGQFEQVFGAPQEDQSSHPLAGLCELPEAAAEAMLAELGYREPKAALDQLLAFRRSQRYLQLPADSKTALDGLLPPLIELAGHFPNAETTLARILALLEAIGRRAPYLALLREYPQTLNQLAKMLSASPWAAQYLSRQPHLLDELLDARALFAAPDWAQKRAELHQRLAGFAGDVERQMDELRHFKQAETFRLLAQDLAGLWTIEKLSDHLADLADLILAETLDLVWAGLPGRHRAQPAFAVIAYGKLGGKEMGYASDLDLVFLYDDAHPDAQEIYAKLAKRLNTWLSTLTPAGHLYETDLRLRPDGAAGLLVSSTAAFEDYQKNQAWTWEHQALTRARPVCGDAEVGRQFAAIRQAVLCQTRDRARLKAEVLEMRQKMHEGHPNPSGLFDLKHDAGGLVDLEFAVQFLILAEAAAHPEMTANIGNIALLKRASELGLLPGEIALPAADAYRELRRLQHAVKLQGEDYARVAPALAAEPAAAVKRLWQAAFEA